MHDPKNSLSRLKLRHLTVILAVGRTGSLQKAAEQLALSQSAISKTLAEAEGLVGAALFERTPLGSQVTLFGEILLRYSGKVNTDLQKASEEFDALLRGESGQLTVGLFTAVAWWDALSRCVNDFQNLAPRARLTLQQGSVEHLLRALTEGEIDLMIGRVYDVSRAGHFHVEPLLMDGGPTFVARADHPLAGRPLSMNQLVAFPWFLPESGILVNALRQALDEVGLSLPSRVIYSHVYPINLAVCARSDMIAVLPSFTVSEVGALYGLRRLPCEIPLGKKLPVSIVWRSDRPLEPVAVKFIERLKSICSEGSAQLPRIGTYAKNGPE